VRASKRELRLSLRLTARPLRGTRLNTYLDSIGPVWSSIHEALNPTGPSSTAIERRGAVQKLMQYTRRLSIQNEGGSHVAGSCERACDSSFLWTCLRGECSKFDLTLRGYVAGAPAPFSNEGNRGRIGSPVSLARFVLGKSTDNPKARAGQGDSTWPQVPIESAGLLACPTQTGVLGAHET